MSKELKLKIGGIGLSVKWDGTPLVEWPHPLYEKFLHTGNSEINLTVHLERPPHYSPDRIVFDGEEEGYWKLYQNGSKYIFEIFDTITRKRSKVCFMEPDFSSGDVYVDSGADLLPQPEGKCTKHPALYIPLLMQPLGQLLITNVLSEGSGIMVHGLGVNDGGKGVAFLGVSGTGKSTLAGFWKEEGGVDILSDEHIIIRKEKGQFFLYGTPWPGMASETSPQKVVLDRIFFIEHYPKNKILGQAFISNLFPLLFLPFWDKERLTTVLSFCEELFGTIKCEKLGFAKNNGIVGFVREAVKSSKHNTKLKSKSKCKIKM